MNSRITVFLALFIAACNPSITAIQDAGTPVVEASIPAVVTPVPAPIEVPSATPAVKDKRSPLEVSQAACRGSDGKWYCKNVKQPTILAATSAPLIPSSWTIANWFVDPANSSGVASDTNACTSSGAPCLTWNEINAHRWGCMGNPTACPRLQQATLITFMSSQSITPPDDPVALNPQIENAGSISITGSLGAGQTVCTGTLAGYANYVTGTSTLTAVTLPCTAAVNELVVDSTVNASFMTYKVNGAAPAYFVSTALSGTNNYTIGTVPSTAETVLANGDTITVFNPVTVNLVTFSPTYAEGGASGSQGSITNITINGGASARDTFNFSGTGQNTFLVNDVIVKGAVYSRLTTRVSSWVNCDLEEGFAQEIFSGTRLASGGPAQNLNLVGGIVGYQNASSVAQNLSFLCLDGDIIVGGNATADTLYAESVGTTGMFLDSNVTLTVGGYSQIRTACLATGVSLKAWGTGTLNAIGKMVYTAGAGAAAVTFPAATLKLSSQTKSCINVPGAASSYGTCNTVISAANLDTNLGATSGCLGTGSLAAFCNYGP